MGAGASTATSEVASKASAATVKAATVAQGKLKIAATAVAARKWRRAAAGTSVAIEPASASGTDPALVSAEARLSVIAGPVARGGRALGSGSSTSTRTGSQDGVMAGIAEEGEGKHTGSEIAILLRLGNGSVLDFSVDPQMSVLDLHKRLATALLVPSYALRVILKTRVLPYPSALSLVPRVRCSTSHLRKSPASSCPS